MKHPKCTHSFEVVSELAVPLRPLSKLAYNFRWTWHEPTQELFRDIDKVLWDAVEHNPVQLLAQLPKERLERLGEDGGFLQRLSRCAEELDQYLSGPNWFDETYPGERERMRVAYFCAEFGISEALPIYSGGLGVLAGDHLKAASDLGIPLVGVGLLYSRGYFRQFLNSEGWQQEHYPQYDFYQLPLQLVRGGDLQPIRVEIEMPDRNVTCQVWKAEVGRVPLYLLDSNVLENLPTDQGITDTLYGGDEEMRILQEMVLGIGGMRALEALGIKPTVCHMNEGHAAFLSLERIRQAMNEHGVDFRTARQLVVGGNVFTTHTPVPAGFDLFHPELLQRYMGGMATAVSLPFPELLKLGKLDPENEGEAFNMAVLAMGNADHVNGVSKLHARVSRGMFHSRWEEFPEDEVPIEPVTNGIHTQTWIAPRMAEVFDGYLDPAWRQRPWEPEAWTGIWNVPDRELWEAREAQRTDLVRFIRQYLEEMDQQRGFGRASIGQVESILDPRVLTIGFARRFATYKRATLMISDRERLRKLLFHPERPVQIVIAGKSHPRDDGGKGLIQELVRFIQHENARARMVFLEDYDMRVARAMVQGVDVWLNNPRRPMEASGTSGMKVVPNGVLNCSILDGWWDEAYEPGLGWAIGERFATHEEAQQDWIDSRTLYHLLETEIAPVFYHRVDGVVPSGWVEMIKRSISKLAPEFSTGRMVKDYTQQAYLPASRTYGQLIENHLQKAKEALKWRDSVRAAWSKVRVAHVQDSLQAVNVLGESFRIEARVDLDGLSPDDVSVQAVVGRVGSNRDLQDVRVMDLSWTRKDGEHHVFETEVSTVMPGHRGYTVRVVPKHDLVRTEHELKLVRWEGH